MINWVVFDLGDVLLTRTEAMPDLAALLCVDEAGLTRAYWGHRAGYDLTSDAAAFWKMVAIESGGTAPSTSLIAELVRVDDLGWNSVDPDALDLAKDLRAAGIRLAVLSNAPSSMGRLVEASPTAALFEHLLFSGDVGLLKPDQAIYRELLQRLAARPADVLFIDDRPVNIAGATAVGIAGIVFTSTDDARQALRKLGLPV